MRLLHLIVAGTPRPPDPRQFPRSLRALLGRGSRHACAAHLSGAIGNAFGLGADLPVAPYTLALDGIAPGDAVWMRADPVCLQANLDHLRMDAADMSLDDTESRALVAALNRHFAGDGLEFLAPVPGRWYLRLAALPQIAAPPPDAVGGRRLPSTLIDGPGARTWLARLNEIQMLLHDHPVNVAREARGEAVVNSVWFWGAGRLAALAPADFAVLAATHPTARALGRAAGLRETQATHLAALADADAALVVLGADAAEQVSPEDRLARIEACWLRPALRRLQTGRLGGLRLDWLDGPGSCVSVTPWQSRQLWRRGIPVAAGAPPTHRAGA